MIGYYVHHHGRGHLSRATAISAALETEMTVLSSLNPPAGWLGSWIKLPRDDSEEPRQPDANGRLHWAPIHSNGLRERMSIISRWIALARPQAFVVDVSVEVAVLARLHGVPVITVALPGKRDDAAHALAFGMSNAIVAAWPPGAAGMIDGLSPAAHERLHAVGAIARYAPSRVDLPRSPTGGKRHVLVLSGAGGDSFSQPLAAMNHPSDSTWDWSHLGGSSGRWSDDPWHAILAADVIITHAGEGILAEIAAARRPAILIPQSRPHNEQITTASALAHSSWPVIVLSGELPHEWTPLLNAADHLDGSVWESWNDGLGAIRAATVIEQVILDHSVSQ